MIRAASTDELHQLLTTPCKDLPAALRLYERARDDAAQVTAHGWDLLAVELRRLAEPYGELGNNARARAEMCDARASAARTFGRTGNA